VSALFLMHMHNNVMHDIVAKGVRLIVRLVNDQLLYKLVDLID
jgi:hypothetical protein